MTRDEILQAEETVMAAVCGLCHWPFVYQRKEEIMYAEKCSYCPASDALSRVLKPLEKEAG